MAIRFQCAACSEPIEVDEEWAKQVVRCPYCQRTVTAPAESTLAAHDQIPVATSIAGRRDALTHIDSVAVSAAVPPNPPHASTNRSAIVGFSLALLTIGFLLLSMQTMSNHQLDMLEYQKFIEEAQSKGTPTMTAVLKYCESQGGAWPGWMVTLSVLGFASIITWLGALVFGIIGLFRQARRGMAVAAVVIAGMLSGMFCLSALGGLAG